LLHVADLKAYYFSSHGISRAVDGVTLTIQKREFLGLVGESGSGKSTLAMSILRLIPPPGRIVGGSVLFQGKDLTRATEGELRRVRWKEISLVFQGAMAGLDPLFTVEHQIVEALLEHDTIDRLSASTKARALLERVGIEESRSRSYPHELSGGMKQRVMIAMALACNPKLIIADEPTSALDVITAATIMDLIRRMQEETQLSMILVTHDLSVAAEVCHSVAVMYAGKIVEVADTSTLFENPLHPYTLGLLGAYPSMEGQKARLQAIPGEPPALTDPPSGCRFHPRCPYAMPVCSAKEPPLIQIGTRHAVACFLHPAPDRESSTTMRQESPRLELG
jgi:peptide/nickel transport system ATP-binding protein